MNKPSFVHLLFAVVACSFAAHSAEGEKSELRPLATKRAESGAQYAILPNGCEIIVMEKHSAPVVSVQGWVRTGGNDENQWMGAGLSHFCEHMLFKGTTKRQRERSIRKSAARAAT